MADRSVPPAPTIARAAWDQVATLHQHVGGDGVELGPSASFQYRTDPKHLCFVLARYKFCAKLLAGKRNVLEVGCGDAIGTPIVAQSVGRITGIDWDQTLIDGNNRRLGFLSNCRFAQQDVSAAAVDGQFDAIYSVDVIEHIDKALEDEFMRHSAGALTDEGVFIAGTPNVRADAYASESSRLGHINLKDAAGLRRLLEQYFHNVFIFSMNDEVVHTGFSEMAHYLFGLGVGVRGR